LPNGITAHTYQGEFPISCVEVILPLGSAHATSANGLLPGSPHFLEHTQLIRSANHPKAYQLDRELGLRAGHTNAATHSLVTNHWIDVPTAEHRFAMDALVERVFSPLFADDDLAVERGVVANERSQKKFYPGKSKASRYYYAGFLSDIFFPLEQIFGTDEDLSAMDRPLLEAMHARASRNRKVQAIAVGNHDFGYFLDRLAALPTAEEHLEPSIAPTTWGKRTFHKAFFDTVPQPRLETAWIHARPGFDDYRALCFFISLLVNSTQGPLHVEFREEKGWTYGLEGGCSLREGHIVLSLAFPVNTLEQVEYVRDCLVERIQAASADQVLVEAEIRRQLGNQIYAYQTAGSIASSASSDLIAWGKIHTEAQCDAAIRRMADPTYRKLLVDTYFAPEDMGSMAFLPERRKLVFER
jgi:predicted Zn-dependent peptidase